MKKITISIAAISFLLFSCGNTTNEKSNEQTTTVAHEEHHHENESEIIKLNNGEKWKVNDEMMPSIKSMEKDIKDFSIDEEKDYKSLAEKLQKNINLLTSSCTMTGEAHDELHKWLLPYIDLVKEFSEAKDETEASKQFKNIQISFATFNQYFQ